VERCRSLAAELRSLLAGARPDLTAFARRVLASTGARWLVRTCQVVEMVSAVASGNVIVAAAVTLLLVVEWIENGVVKATEERVRIPLPAMAYA
jgi:hypothetical protein